MFGGQGGSRGAGVGFTGGSKAVQFSRTTTTADASFATITVTLPRSSKPIGMLVSVSTGIALVQVQGNGVELYGGSVSQNLPLQLNLPGFPETTSVNVQVEQLAVSTIAGSLFYN
jgi:hypothetical protein